MHKCTLIHYFVFPPTVTLFSKSISPQVDSLVFYSILFYSIIFYSIPNNMHMAMTIVSGKVKYFLQ